MKKKIKIIVEKSKTGYAAYAQDMGGFTSAGDNWLDLKQNVKEGFVSHLELLKEFKEKDAFDGDYKLNFSLDVKQLFDDYSIFNISALSDHLGMNKQLLHQYKDGHKLPSEKTSLKIINGLEMFAKQFLPNN